MKKNVKEKEITVVYLDQRFEDMAIMVNNSFNHVQEEFTEVYDRFDTMDARFDAVDNRFNNMDIRMDAFDNRFNTVDDRFDMVEKKLDTILHNMATKHDLKKLELRIEKIEESM